MVNENLKLIENKKPVETVYELKNYEIKTSKLSPAARAKVIKKYGGNYVSENREDYGPGNSMSSDDETRLGKGITGVISGIGLAALTIVCPPAGATAIAVVGGAGVGAKVASNFVPEDSKLHEVLNDVGDTYIIAGSVGSAPSGARWAKNVATGKLVIK